MLQLKTPLPAEAICVGIDVTKATLQVQIDSKHKSFTARNTPAGRSALADVAGAPNETVAGVADALLGAVEAAQGDLN